MYGREEVQSIMQKLTKVSKNLEQNNSDLATFIRKLEFWVSKLPINRKNSRIVKELLMKPLPDKLFDSMMDLELDDDSGIPVRYTEMMSILKKAAKQEKAKIIFKKDISPEKFSDNEDTSDDNSSDSDEEFYKNRKQLKKEKKEENTKKI